MSRIHLPRYKDVKVARRLHTTKDDFNEFCRSLSVDAVDEEMLKAHFVTTGHIYMFFFYKE